MPVFAEGFVVREWLRRMFERRLMRRAERWSDGALRRPALVVAPHPDDETLGCGGTIALKRRAGADVTIVFVSDGTASHAGRIEEQTLRELRREEARAAGAVLGVPADRLVFLGLPDGRLRTVQATIVDRLVELIARGGVTQVFAPYRFDTTDDHVVVHAAAREAIERAGGDVGLYEYPVWFWRRWPWSLSRGRGVRRVLRNAKDAWLWWRALGRDFTEGLDISDVIESKRRALACHRSQMERRDGTTDWPILADVAGGTFLACFFERIEPLATGRR